MSTSASTAKGCPIIQSASSGVDIVAPRSGTDPQALHADRDTDATFGKVESEWSRLYRFANVEWHLSPQLLQRMDVTRILRCNEWLCDQHLYFY